MKRVPQQRRELGDRARRDLRLRRAAEALRHDDVQGGVRARGAARRRRLGPGRAARSPICAARPTACSNDPDSKQTFLVNGQTPALYSIIRNPGLAKALRLIQEQGRDAFYKGDIADAIVAKVQANGGVMTKDDLAEFQSEWVEPISTNYHGYDVFELPPPGQGFAALEMLNILEVCVPKLGMNLAALGPSDPMYWHLMVEAKKLAYTDLLRVQRRSEVREGAGRASCSRRRTPRRCAARSIRTWPSKPGVAGGLDGGTIYLTTADRWGNMVSLIHSVFSVYGSRATVRAVRLRAAQPRLARSRSIRRARTSSRRTSGRSTRSSPAS